jgi:hypothetical protein
MLKIITQTMKYILDLLLDKVDHHNIYTASYTLITYGTNSYMNN